ncbi:MAG: tetratricopeptide repeat protein [Cyanobacteriota bacterium]|nr:tetratricopeptide repeat protein [Cyanobacteriota bacterium]
MKLARRLSDRGQVNTAISTYRNLLERQPELADARLALGQLYERQGQEAEAIGEYRRGLHRSPGKLALWLHLGNCYYRGQDLERATDCYQRAIDLKPDYIRALYQLGMVLHERGELEAAARSYQAAIGYCAAGDRENPDYANAYNNLGCIFVALGQFDRALEVYGGAQKISPHSPALHNNLGQLWFVRGNLDRAIAAYRRAVKLEPQNGLFHHNLGQALQRQDRHSEAIAAFDKAIALDPDRLEAYDDCARSRMAVGQFGEAFAYLAYILQQQPHWVEGYVGHRSPEESEDELEQARAACGEFLRALQQQSDRQSDPLEIARCLARTYYYLGRVRQALADEAAIGDRQIAEIESYLRWQLVGLAVCQISDRGSSVEAIGLLRGMLLSSRTPASRTPASAAESPHLKSSVTPISRPRGVYPSVREWWQENQRGDYIDLDVGFDGESAAVRVCPLDPPPKSEVPRPSDSGKNCAGLNCDRCLKKIFNGFGFTHHGSGIYECRQTQPLEFPEFDRFVAVIPEGRVWSMPQKSWWQVCEAIAVISPDGYLLEDVSREYPGRLPGCDRQERPQHRIFQQQELPAIEYIDGTVVSLLGLSGNVYFHWTIDILPRVEILRRSGIDWNKIDKFLVNQCQQPFQKETLAQLGIPPEKIIESDRHAHIKARQLIIPSFAGYLGWLSPRSIDFLRQTFLPTALSQLQETRYLFPERIYIRRAQAKYRHLFNEDEVVDRLQEQGFVAFALETMSFFEQVLLFHRAKIIIAPHGSGLTNIVFCQPQTQIIELTSPHYIRHYFRAISQHLNLQHFYVIGEVLPSHFLRDLMYPSALAADIYFRPHILEQIFNKLGVMQTLPSTQLKNSTTPLVKADRLPNSLSSIGSKEDFKLDLETGLETSPQTNPQAGLNENSNNNSNPLALEYQKQAEQLLSQKKFTEAIEVSKQAIKADSNLAPAYKILGNALRANGQLEEAKCWYEKAIQIQPLYAEAYANIGNVLFQQQQWKPAIEYYQKAIEVRPNFAGAYHHLSKVWLKVGSPRSSADCLYRAYELDPKLGRAEDHLNLGNTLLQENQLTQAISCYRRALELNPQLFGAHQNLAEALTRQGRFVEATQYYRMAVKLGLTNSSSTHQVSSEALSLNPAVNPSTNPSTQIARETAIVPSQTPTLPIPTPEGTRNSQQPPTHPEPVSRVEIDRGTPAEEGSGLGKWLFGMGAAIGTRIGMLLGSAPERSLETPSNRSLSQEYLDLGNTLLKHQEIHRAMHCYRQAIDATPQMTDAVYNNLETSLQNALAQKGSGIGNDRLDAFSETSSALASPQHVARGFVGMGDVLLRYQQLDRALNCYQEALKTNPAVAQTIYRNLETAFEAVLERTSGGDELRALPEKTGVAAQSNLGMTPLLAGQIEPAPTSTTNPQSDYLDNNSMSGNRANLEPKTPRAQGENSGNLDRLESGMLQVRPPLQQTRTQPDPVGTPPGRSIEQMLQQAQTQCQGGNFKGAIGLCKQVIQMQPKAWAAYHIAGESLIGLGNLEEADRHYQKAIVLQPKLAKSYLNLGNCYFDRQEWQQAGTIYQRVVRLAPKLARAHDRLGDVCVIQGQLERAIGCYETALKFDNSTWEIHHKIGDILQAQGKLKEATEAYFQATQTASVHLQSDEFKIS